MTKPQSPFHEAEQSGNRLLGSEKAGGSHIPVLLNEVLQYLDPKAGDSYLDLTAGYGGHASKVLETTNAPEATVLVDRDAKAVDELQKRFGGSVQILHTNFLSASKQLLESGKRFDCILADLGVSSPHLNNAERGFSIRHSGPLDMRMDQGQGKTAADIVNTYDESQLTDILRRYGEEPKANKIAKLLVANRPMTTTTEVAEIVARAWPGRGRIHPATRTFQALRIAVNDELEQLSHALGLWFELLKPGGRLAVISFHSLEDRIVKQYFGEITGNRYDAEAVMLTKQPVMAGKQELVLNPRSRSAKLRAVSKQK